MRRGRKQSIEVRVTQDRPKKKRGCLSWFFALIAICFALALYSIAWIPAVVCIIYFAIRRDYAGTRTRNILISAAVMVTSLFLFAGMMASPDLTSLQADWGKAKFDISETTEVKITGYPDDAKIESLELSENNIAELDYTDGKAIIKFTETGEAALFFTANGDIDSATTTITVVDKEAEEQARKEAEEKAEQERIAQEQAEIEAQEQAQQSQASANMDSQEQMVWIPQSGSKYHSNSSCSGMNNPRQVTISEAQNMGYKPCNKCY